jgi:uncharacterized repeat protein (TIGR03943 family)
MSTQTHTSHAHPIEHEKESRSVSPSRVLTALVLAGWAGLFWYLWLSGRSVLYLGSRTLWLVPVGAVILSVTTVGRLVTLRVAEPKRVRAKEAWATVIILLPVLLVTSLPSASLGTFAVGKRSTLATAGITSSTDLSKGDLNLVDVAGALADRATMRQLSSRAGSTVSFKGFVDRIPGQGADEFMLTRFVITCCVADAIAAQVHVVDAPPGKFSPDDWVRVTGQMYPLGREIIVVAAKTESVAKPKHPYLYP